MSIFRPGNRLKHIEKYLKIKETSEEPIYFSEYNSEALEKIIDTQRKITEYQKNKNIQSYIRY